MPNDHYWYKLCSSCIKIIVGEAILCADTWCIDLILLLTVVALIIYMMSNR